jgi:mono/diheme cytochrome c family protein
MTFRRRRPGVAALLLAAGAAFGPTAPAGAGALRFLRDDVEVARLDLDALRSRCAVQTIAVLEPYSGRRVRYLACPLGDVVRLGFGEEPAALAGHDVLFRALDGYMKPTTAARLGEHGGFAAFAEADRPGGGFSPLGRKGVDPGPFYVVWTGASQREADGYPWPYQLEAIEVTDLTTRYPHIAPRDTPHDGLAWAGFGVFRGQCIACHSVNGEGGRVGPDLNVPMSIVEYRPVEQLKRYIRNPATFRYGNMPPQTHLTPHDLDALIAYFEVMRTQKHDPGASR